MHLEDLSGIDSQRTVYIYRNLRQLVSVVEVIQDINYLLRPADGKRRYDELAFFPYTSVFDDLQQLLLSAFSCLMQSVSVGTLRDDIVALRESVRRFQQIAVVTPNVACISYLRDMSVLVNPDGGTSTAEHVPGVVKLHGDIVVDVKTAVHLRGDKQLHTLTGVFLRVDRLHTFQALTRAFLVKPVCIVFL